MADVSQALTYLYLRVMPWLKLLEPLFLPASKLYAACLVALIRLRSEDQGQDFALSRQMRYQTASHSTGNVAIPGPWAILVAEHALI